MYRLRADILMNRTRESWNFLKLWCWGLKTMEWDIIRMRQTFILATTRLDDEDWAGWPDSNPRARIESDGKSDQNQWRGLSLVHRCFESHYHYAEMRSDRTNRWSKCLPLKSLLIEWSTREYCVKKEPRKVISLAQTISSDRAIRVTRNIAHLIFGRYMYSF